MWNQNHRKYEEFMKQLSGGSMDVSGRMESFPMPGDVFEGEDGACGFASWGYMPTKDDKVSHYISIEVIENKNSNNSNNKQQKQQQ